MRHAPETAESLRAYVKLFRASRAVLARVEANLAELSLTLNQLGVLEAILHKGPLSHRELGRKVLTSAGNMTDVVDKLEQRGLVRRVRHTGDRRSVKVELTDEGNAMIEALFPIHATRIHAAMSGLNDAQLRQLGDLLRSLGVAAEEGREE
jgi:MarR family 2-MHQ and catechol resistance regulon transcriptional repressor